MHDTDRRAQDMIQIEERRIKGAIFDIDGTLIDSMPIWDQLGMRYLRSVGRTPDEDLSRILFPMTLEEGVHYIRETYRLSETEEEIRNGLMAELDHFYLKEVPLKKGAKETVEKLAAADVPMVLATIGDKKLGSAALERLGIKKFFEDFFNCDDYGTTKRESTIYRVCARYLGLRPEEIAVFEDVLPAVRAAKRAGFYTIAVHDKASDSDQEALKAEADLYIASFDELQSKMKTV